MNITFLVPCKDLSGGLKVVAAHGNALLRRGHDVAVVYPRRMLSWRKRLRTSGRRLAGKRDHLDAFAGRLLEVPELTAAFLPDGDRLVATSWETAAAAAGLPRRCGLPAYFIQGWETWSGREDRVLETFRWPARKITVSIWLKEAIEKAGGGPGIEVVPNGRDFFLSEARGEGLKRNLDVGFIYSPLPIKGAAAAWRTLELVRRVRPGLRVIVFGAERPPEGLPSGVRFCLRPRQELIRSIYLSTRVWLSPGVSEGFGLPALEAMSLGAVVVAADSKGVKEVLTDGIHGRIVPPDHPEAMAEAVAGILSDDSLRVRYIKAGLRKAEEFSWARSVESFEAVLVSMGKGGDDGLV